MGKIGHDLLLHNMKNWQIRAAIRGNDRTQHTIWEATRQHCWYILSALGAKNLYTPQDLVRFPWETDPSSETTQEDVEELRKIMRNINEGKTE